MGSKHFIQLLVFRSGFILVVDVSKFGLLISGDALLDVLFLLAQLQLFAVIANHIAHCVHLVLNALTARSYLSLTSLLFFQGHSHILLNLFRFVHFRLLCLIGELLFRLHIVLDDFHGSLALSLFRRSFVGSLFLELGSKFSNTIAFLSLALISVHLLLLLDLFEHLVSLHLGLDNLLLLLDLLLPFDLQLLPRLVEDALVEILFLLICFFTQLLPEFDLLVQNLFDLLDAILLLLFGLAQLLFVELLAELLDLAPLVFADVRGQVFHILATALDLPIHEVIKLRLFGRRRQRKWLRLRFAIMSKRRMLCLH